MNARSLLILSVVALGCGSGGGAPATPAKPSTTLTAPYAKTTVDDLKKSLTAAGWTTGQTSNSSGGAGNGEMLTVGADRGKDTHVRVGWHCVGKAADVAADQKYYEQTAGTKTWVKEQCVLAVTVERGDKAVADEVGKAILGP